MKNPKNVKIDYISAARRVNPPRSGVYFWTLVCPKVVKCIIDGANMWHLDDFEGS
jgi:hypothetical protein